MVNEKDRESVALWDAFSKTEELKAKFPSFFLRVLALPQECVAAAARAGMLCDTASGR